MLHIIQAMVCTTSVRSTEPLSPYNTTNGKCKDHHSPSVPMMTMMSTVSSLRGRSTSSGVSRPRRTSGCGRTRTHCPCGAPPPLSARTRSGLGTGTCPNCPGSSRSCPPHEPYRPLQLHGLLVQEEQAAEAASVVLLPWNMLMFRRKPGQVRQH